MSEQKRRGVAVVVDGVEYYFQPFRAGPVDAWKRKKMYELLAASEEHIATAGQTIDAFGESYEKVCQAIVEFGEALLADNYTPDEAADIAGRLAPYHASALMAIAREGKLPADFTMDEVSPTSG